MNKHSEAVLTPTVRRTQPLLEKESYLSNGPVQTEDCYRRDWLSVGTILSAGGPGLNMKKPAEPA